MSSPFPSSDTGVFVLGSSVQRALGTPDNGYPCYAKFGEVVIHKRTLGDAELACAEMPLSLSLNPLPSQVIT